MEVGNTGCQQGEKKSTQPSARRGRGHGTKRKAPIEQTRTTKKRKRQKKRYVSKSKLFRQHHQQQRQDHDHDDNMSGDEDATLNVSLPDYDGETEDKSFAPYRSTAHLFSVAFVKHRILATSVMQQVAVVTSSAVDADMATALEMAMNHFTEACGKRFPKPTVYPSQWSMITFHESVHSPSVEHHRRQFGLYWKHLLRHIRVPTNDDERDRIERLSSLLGTVMVSLSPRAYAQVLNFMRFDALASARALVNPSSSLSSVAPAVDIASSSLPPWMRYIHAFFSSRPRSFEFRPSVHYWQKLMMDIMQTFLFGHPQHEVTTVGTVLNDMDHNACILWFVTCCSQCVVLRINN